MNVFWLLFLVLVNQGDTNLTDQEESLLPLVSMRDGKNHHICTGSIITELWVLTYFVCEAAFVFHGPREFEGSSTFYLKYMRRIVAGKIWIPYGPTRIYKVERSFDSSLLIPDLPNTKSSLPETGKVIGWSFNEKINKYVMEIIPNVNIEMAFSGKNNEYRQAFSEIEKGSPLIAGKFIYGLITDHLGHVVNILRDVDMINKVVKPNVSCY